MAKPRYAATEIAMPLDGYRLHIDDAGDIAGTATGERAFLYSNGVATYLGPLPGDAHSSVSSMSADGLIIGTSYTSSTLHTFLYQDGVMTVLGDAVIGNSTVFDINNSGVVVGEMENVPGVLEGGALTTIIGSIGYSGEAYAINNTGMVVGALSNPGSSDVAHAFAYSNNTLTYLPGIPTDVFSAAVDVNDLGQIIGTLAGATYFGLNSGGFLYSNGVVTDLGQMALPIAINNQGQIIGSSNRGAEDAYLYENGRTVDLNTLINSQWTLSEPQSINAYGVIVGMGITPTKGYAGIQLTPLPILAVPGKKSFTTSRTSMVVRGRADFSTRHVLYRVGNKGKFKHAKGTVKWHFVAKLTKGKNQITIRSLGLNGYSDTMRLTITRD